MAPKVMRRPAGRFALARRCARSRELVRQMLSLPGSLRECRQNLAVLVAAAATATRDCAAAHRLLMRVHNYGQRLTLPRVRGYAGCWHTWETDYMDCLHEFQFMQRRSLRATRLLRSFASVT